MPNLIASLPAALQAQIQQGLLVGELQLSLRPSMHWRSLALKEECAPNIGEVVTKTKNGLAAPSDDSTTLQAAGADNVSNTFSYSVEQYSYQVQTRAAKLTPSPFLPNAAIASINTFKQALMNAAKHGEHSLNRSCRDNLYAAYGGGNTFTTASGTTTTTLVVQSTVGFEQVMVNGVPTTVSASNPGQLSIAGAAAVNYVAVVNATTITLAANASWSAYDSVVRSDAAQVFRAGDRATDRAVISTDVPTMALFRKARTYLLGHNVPGIMTAMDDTPIYVCYIDEDVENTLANDAEWTAGKSAVGITGDYAIGALSLVSGILFKRQSKLEMGTLSGSPYQTTIHRSFMLGAEALIEPYAREDKLVGAAQSGAEGLNHLRLPLDSEGILWLVVKGPTGDLGRSVDVSWVANVDFAVPTDSKALTGTQRYKRACLIHSA